MSNQLATSFVTAGSALSSLDVYAPTTDTEVAHPPANSLECETRDVNASIRNPLRYTSPELLDARVCDTSCIRSFDEAKVVLGIGHVYFGEDGRAGHIAAADANTEDRVALAYAAEALLAGATSATAPGIQFDKNKARWSYILYVSESDVDTRRAVSIAVSLLLGEVAHA